METKADGDKRACMYSAAVALTGGRSAGPPRHAGRAKGGHEALDGGGKGCAEHAEGLELGFDVGGASS